MSDLQDEFEPIDHLEAFKHGRPEAFRHFFRQHNYRIYCYLLRQSRDPRRSRELTKHCFIVLFRNYTIVKDEAHMLRILYMLAKISLLLQLLEPNAVHTLEDKWKVVGEDDEIMDDPAVTSNETLVAVQRALQMLSCAKRELAELYFFQGMSVKDIAHFLGVEEAAIRKNISQMLERLGEDLAGRSKLNLLIVA